MRYFSLAAMHKTDIKMMQASRHKQRPTEYINTNERKGNVDFLYDSWPPLFATPPLLGQSQRILLVASQRNRKIENVDSSVLTMKCFFVVLSLPLSLRSHLNVLTEALQTRIWCRTKWKKGRRRKVQEALNILTDWGDHYHWRQFSCKTNSYSLVQHCIPFSVG